MRPNETFYQMCARVAEEVHGIKDWDPREELASIARHLYADPDEAHSLKYKALKLLLEHAPIEIRLLDDSAELISQPPNSNIEKIVVTIHHHKKKRGKR